MSTGLAAMIKYKCMQIEHVQFEAYKFAVAVSVSTIFALHSTKFLHSILFRILDTDIVINIQKHMKWLFFQLLSLLLRGDYTLFSSCQFCIHCVSMTLRDVVVAHFIAFKFYWNHNKRFHLLPSIASSNHNGKYE